MHPAAVAPIRPLAWEPPYVTGAVKKGKKKKWNKNLNETDQCSFLRDVLRGWKATSEPGGIFAHPLPTCNHFK